MGSPTWVESGGCVRHLDHFPPRYPHRLCTLNEEKKEVQPRFSLHGRPRDEGRQAEREAEIPQGTLTRWLQPINSPTCPRAAVVLLMPVKVLKWARAAVKALV